MRDVWQYAVKSPNQDILKCGHAPHLRTFLVSCLYHSNVRTPSASRTYGLLGHCIISIQWEGLGEYGSHVCEDSATGRCGSVSGQYGQCHGCQSCEGGKEYPSAWSKASRSSHTPQYASKCTIVIIACTMLCNMLCNIEKCYIHLYALFFTPLCECV